MTIQINQCDMITRYRLKSTFDRGTDQTNPSFIADVYQTSKMTSGNGARQASLMYVDAGKLAPSGTKTYDLDNITSQFNNTVAFANVRGLLIRNKNANTSTVTISLSGDFLSSNGLDGKVGPAGLNHFFREDSTGYAVTATTGDELVLTNDSATEYVDYEVVIVGSALDASSSSSSSSSTDSSSSSSSSQSASSASSESSSSP